MAPSPNHTLTTQPDSDRVLIFANPIAGRGVGTTIATQLAERFRDDGLEVISFLQKPSEIKDQEIGKRPRAVVVIGGDGTLRGVAERLLQADTFAPLLTVPLGTANLMGQHLGIRWELPTVAAQVSEAVSRYRIRHLDAGRANGGLFLLMAGVGFDAQVVHHLDRIRRGPIQFWDYLLPTALSFLDYPAIPLRVIVDEKEVFPMGSAIAFVGNLAEYGTGFPILSYAQPDDQLLDVCVMPCRSRAELVQLFLLAASGEHVRAEGVVYVRGKRVIVESANPIPVQVDGDPAGTTPLQIDLLPVRLPFIVP